VSALPELRDVLVRKQRIIGEQHPRIVTEGRDQGSVVFPDADAKFFVDAADTRRAQRRYHEMVADGEDVAYEDVLENLRQRDAKDKRQWTPLLEPGQAIQIDTTEMNIAQVVERMMQDVQRLERERDTK